MKTPSKKSAKTKRLRPAQAMIESVLALLFATFVFLVAITLARLLYARILLTHAARSAARSRAVGFNDFMCLKTARAAMIPVAGRRLWPERDSAASASDAAFDERARIPRYLASATYAEARGALDYEFWPNAEVDVRTIHSLAPLASAYIRLATDEIVMDGSAAIEAHYPLYMEEERP